MLLSHIPRKGIHVTIRQKKRSKIFKAELRHPQRLDNLLGALASTTGSVVAHGASGAHSRAALADVVADVVVAAADLAVDGGSIFRPSDTLEVAGLVKLAGGRVDGAALGDGDLAVVAGALAADLDFGAGELGLDVLVYAGVLGC
jgi:hypothetical protein